METQVNIHEVVIQNRIRKDMGDIAGLAKSIQENGLIEPLVLAIDYDVESQKDFIRLIAGERRITALKSLGIINLIHAEHFIWRSELESNDPKKKLLAVSIEMEENLRRKELTWVEQVEGKARLLKIMQELHGQPLSGRPTAGQAIAGNTGFSGRKLSAMLGESPEQTSNDLELASMLDQIPLLKDEPSRDAARRKLELAMKIALGTKAPNVAAPLKYQILITCKDEEEQKSLLAQFKSAGMTAVPVVS